MHAHSDYLKFFMPINKQKEENINLGSSYNIKTVIDVGVASGTPWLYKSFPRQNLILVDPIFDSKGLSYLLEGRSYELHKTALGTFSGELPFYVNTSKTSQSSALVRTPLTASPTAHIVRTSVPITTLDLLVEGSKFEGPYGLKIDTEGYELLVIQGAQRVLKECLFVCLEVSIAKRFEESYTFSELIVTMSQMGFEVKRLLRVGQDYSGLIRFADILFERKIGDLP